MKTLTDHSEGDRKVNKNSLTDRSERDRKVNNNPPTDRSEGHHKVNKNSPSDQIERENSRSIEKNIYPQRDQVGAIIRQNNKSSSGMSREGDNKNDEYYIRIQTRSG